MMRAAGEMPEWPNGTDSKSVVPSRVPRVQIPISPPLPIAKAPELPEFRGLLLFDRPAFESCLRCWYGTTWTQCYERISQALTG